MDFQTAIKYTFKNWLDFSRRASRSEYWNFVLFTVIVTFVAAMIDRNLVGAMTYSGTGIVSGISSLVLFIPGISLMIRRLHDLNKSGWWLWLLLLPLVGPIIILVWFCTKGTTGANGFGADPLATDYIDHQ